MAIGTLEALVLDRFCGTLSTDTRLESAAQALPRLTGRTAQLHEILMRHKGFTFFDAALTQLADRPEAGVLAALIAADLSARRAHYQLLLTELDWLRSLGPDLSGCTVIKGFGNARFYPDPSVRWSRDIDLFVPSWEQALELVVLLRNRGYAFDPQECPWVKAEPGRGRKEYGQVFLIRPIGDGYARVDIHFGTYSVGNSEYLLPALTEFYRPEALGGLDATGALLVMCAHALSDGYVSIKDANDCVAMATSAAEVDWPRMRTEIRRHSFAPQAALLARYLTEQHDHPAVTEFAARLGEAALPGPRRATLPSPLWRMHDRDWVRRATVNSAYSLRAGLRQRRGPLGAAIRAAQCFAFYVRRLDVRVGRRSLRERLLLSGMATCDLSGWQLRPDACPTLVHVEHPILAAVLGPVKIPKSAAERLSPTPLSGVRVGRQTLLIGSDLFVPTWDQIVTPSQLAEVRALLAEAP